MKKARPSWGGREYWAPPDGSATKACKSPPLHPPIPNTCKDGQSFHHASGPPSTARARFWATENGVGGHQGSDATDRPHLKEAPLQGRREWPERYREGGFCDSENVPLLKICQAVHSTFLHGCYRAKKKKFTKKKIIRETK